MAPTARRQARGPRQQHHHTIIGEMASSWRLVKLSYYDNPEDTSFDLFLFYAHTLVDVVVKHVTGNEGYVVRVHVVVQGSAPACGCSWLPPTCIHVWTRSSAVHEQTMHEG